MAERTIATQEPRPDGREGTRAQDRYLQPPVDIYETPEGLTLLADLPGCGADDVDIEVEDGVLSLRGRARHALDGDAVHREFELRDFFRQFQITDQVDASGITAEFRHGVLKLQLPRAERTKAKQIQVTVE